MLNTIKSLFFTNGQILTGWQFVFQFISQRVLRVNYKCHWPVHPTSFVKSPEKVEIGNRCPGLSIGCYIDGRNGIKIGNNTWIGPRVSLISQNHDIDDLAKYVKSKPIIIGSNCLIATNSIILPGVNLGDRTIVAAGSVVTKSFEKGNCLIAGNPAEIKKEI